MAVIKFVPAAASDYLALDGSVRLEVDKAIAKLQTDPEKYGESLGKKAGINLFGFFSIRAGRRVRLIYSIDGDVVMIRVIGMRERFSVHRTAEERIRALADLATAELKTLEELVTKARDEGG